MQLRDVSKVATAIANGDLTRKIRGVSGVWKDLTENVNVMASNLTKQVRGIVKVVTAVANGDLSQKFVLEAKGEVAALAETINNMTDTLRIFADQVTTVAREVGIEGKLGGQAKVPGAAGTWRDLTDNVNQLAGNLTSQVRAIGEVSTAVAKGALTRSITVEAQGEVAVLKDNINQMIGNLKDTTHKNQEQDWLKTNLARFSSMMQGQRSVFSIAQLIMSELTPLVDAQQGAFYLFESESGETILNLVASYGFGGRKSLNTQYRLRESLIGQCAFEKKRILLSEVPSDFMHIATGMGEASPRSVIVLPVLFEGEAKAVIELASFSVFSLNHLTFLDQLMGSVGVIHQHDIDKHANRRVAAAAQEVQCGTRCPSGRAQRKGQIARAQEQRGRASESQPGGKGRATTTNLELQVRILGEHVPRTSRTAEQPVDSLAIVSRKSQPQSDP